MSIKERWNNLKYWRKAGFLTGLFGSIWFFIFYIYLAPYSFIGKSIFFRFLWSVLGSPTLIVLGIYLNLTRSDMINTIFIQPILLMVSFILYYVLGSALGHIYFDLKKVKLKKDFAWLGSSLLNIAVIILYILLTSVNFILILIAGD